MPAILFRAGACGSMGSSLSFLCMYSPAARNILRRIFSVVLLVSVARGASALEQATPKPTPPSTQAASPFDEAAALLSQGSVEQAKQKIQEQLALHPSSVEGYNLLGIAFTSEKDYKSALAAFQHALKLAPGSTKTHNNLGNLYVAEGKIDLAKEQFQQTLRLAPGDRDANYNLGLLLLSANKPAVRSSWIWSRESRVSHSPLSMRPRVINMEPHSMRTSGDSTP